MPTPEEQNAERDRVVGLVEPDAYRLADLIGNETLIASIAVSMRRIADVWAPPTRPAGPAYPTYVEPGFDATGIKLQFDDGGPFHTVLTQKPMLTAEYVASLHTFLDLNRTKIKTLREAELVAATAGWGTMHADGRGTTLSKELREQITLWYDDRYHKAVATEFHYGRLVLTPAEESALKQLRQVVSSGADYGEFVLDTCAVLVRLVERLQEPRDRTGEPLAGNGGSGG